MMTLLRAMCLLMLSPIAWGQSATTSKDDAVQNGEPVTTLKVVTRMVAISAVVKSKDGQLRGGLTKDDFLLRQDGKEEPIGYFSLGSELPLTLALMVDTSGSQRAVVGDELLASDVFFESMLTRQQDRAMLVQFDNSVVALKSMTNSANALHLALLNLSSRASQVGGTLLNDAVYGVAKNVMTRETGRKAMVILTDGGDNGSRRSLAEAIEQAQRGDVQIYSVFYSMKDFVNPTMAAHPMTPDSGFTALQKLSESTGGRVFTVSRTMSLREIFAQISEDLRRQYELGYTPPAETQVNTYHRLELTAKDKKLTVQARKGFFAQP